MVTPLAVLTILLMIIAILASILPLVPGPLAVWALGLAFAFITELQYVGWPGIIIMSILMVVGATADFWAPALGMKAEGGSCLSIVGGLVGGIVGTLLIPIPVIGTLLGLLGGTLIFEYARFGEFQRAVRTGRSALKAYILGYIVEAGIAAAIGVVFLLALLL